MINDEYKIRKKTRHDELDVICVGGGTNPFVIAHFFVHQFVYSLLLLNFISFSSSIFLSFNFKKFTLGLMRPFFSSLSFYDLICMCLINIFQNECRKESTKQEAGNSDVVRCGIGIFHLLDSAVRYQHAGSVYTTSGVSNAWIYNHNIFPGNFVK